VSETSLSTLGKILAFAAVVEIGTGLALMIDPAIVVTLLLAGLRGFDLRCGDLARASVRKRLMGLNARSRQVPEVVVVQTLVLAGG